MTRLSLTPELVSSLIAETAPLVTTITGWDLELGSLSSEVIPREQGYEAIVEDRLRALGIPVEGNRGFAERAVEYLLENNMLAAYEPLTNKLMVISENVDDSNLDGLKLVLGHELTHRGQHVHHPDVFSRVNRALVEAFAEANQPKPDLNKIAGYFREVQPLMTMIESHATYVQGILFQQYFPHAQIERHFTLPVVLFSLLGFGKIAQYTEGLPQVARAAQQGNTDSLFRGLIDSQK